METVVLWFSDVEGSTGAWTASGARMLRAIEQHDQLLRAAIGRHGGVEFKHSGDGLLATFPTVTAAVSAAVDGQGALAVADWGDGPALRVRIAVHAGTAYRRGNDWFGLALSRCARLVDLAHGGQVLVSGSAALMLRESPADSVELVDLGRVDLRGLRELEHVWQVGAPGLQAEFPPLRQARSRIGNLPLLLSSLIGRGTEIDQVRAAMTEARIVVLTGAGGVGKTRLALDVAASAAVNFSSGAWLIELAAAGEPADVEPLMAGALGFARRAGRSALASIVEGIGDREMLVVLDNCEHLLEQVADLSGELLRRCPRMSILATSREPLDVEAEHIVIVPPLRVDSDAVELFIARAHEANASFQPDDRAMIEDICRRLDGIPLAIELAAAHVRTLRLPDLVARLGVRLDVSTTAHRGRVDRHRTLRAALDWSYDLLTEDERVAFARLSVFTGRFDLEAAEVVVAGSRLAADVFDLVSSLVDKSMIAVDARGLAPFRLLEPIRHYGAERLAAEGETSDVARRHARYFAELSARLATELGGSNEVEASARLESARDNLRGAFGFAVASGDADLAIEIVAALGCFTNQHVWAEPWSWCQTALTMPGAEHHPLRAAALVHASHGAWQLGEHAGALALAVDALALAAPASTTWCDAQAARATALTFLGRLVEADEAATIAVESRPNDTDGFALGRVAGMVLIRNLIGRREPELARQLLERASLSSPTVHALSLHVASMVAVDDRATAIRYNQHAAELAASTGAVLIEGFALVKLAALEATADPISGAKRYLDVMAHYLRVGNHVHLRGFGRGAIVPLVACGAYEPAATIEAATSADAVMAAASGTSIDDAIARVHEELGAAYGAAAAPGLDMTDDELVHFLANVVASL